MTAVRGRAGIGGWQDPVTNKLSGRLAVGAMAGRPLVGQLLAVPARRGNRAAGAWQAETFRLGSSSSHGA